MIKDLNPKYKEDNVYVVIRNANLNDLCRYVGKTIHDRYLFKFVSESMHSVKKTKSGKEYNLSLRENEFD